MSSNRCLAIFSYDIRDDRRRRRVARLLEDQMVRVQYSVFEAPLTPGEIDDLKAELHTLMSSEDSLRIYVLTADAKRRSCAVGGVPFPEEQGYFLFE